MIEAGAVIDLNGEVVLWHLPPNRSGGSLPDSPDLWTYLWENRQNITGFAHSHPGHGIPGPSWEDLTTFAAIEQGLGMRLNWYISSATHTIRLWWHQGGTNHRYDMEVIAKPYWFEQLREYSK